MTDQLTTVLIVTMPNRPARCFQVTGGQIQIGRGQNNHLTIDDVAVSKTHCELVKSPDSEQWIFRDLGSTNGSEINGDIVGYDVRMVDEGDEITLGSVVRVMLLSVNALKTPESLSNEIDDDPNVNPVAAAVARQSKEDLEGTQLIKLKAKKRH